jgi:hypothetical protein
VDLSPSLPARETDEALDCVLSGGENAGSTVLLTLRRVETGEGGRGMLDFGGNSNTEAMFTRSEAIPEQGLRKYRLRYTSALTGFLPPQAPIALRQAADTLFADNSGHDDQFGVASRLSTLQPMGHSVSYRNPQFITVSTRACHWTLTRAT